jgi:hypothetical protein
MSTNKIILRSVDEFMSGYTPVYKPFYPLFLKKSKSYPSEVGKIDFKRVEAIGDIRAKRLTPKDTVIKEISVQEGTKTFKKYFNANRYVQSSLQDTQGIEDIVAQVLDEHQKQADDLFLLGEGTSASNMINNGLFWSADPFYRLESSVEVASASGHLPSFHTKIMDTVALAEPLAGEKVLIVYGTSACSKLDSLWSDSNRPFKSTLQEVLTGWSIVKLPSQVTPSNANGWIVANLDQCMLHHTEFPNLKDQGVNTEFMYSWHNFMHGSMMLEVLAQDGVIRQPCTFAA